MNISARNIFTVIVTLSEFVQSEESETIGAVQQCSEHRWTDLNGSHDRNTVFTQRTKRVGQYTIKMKIVESLTVELMTMVYETHKNSSKWVIRV